MDLRDRRRIMGLNQEVGNIQAIISHGTEFIVTDVYPTSAHVVIIDATITDYTTYSYLYGYLTNYNVRNYVQCANNAEYFDSNSSIWTIANKTYAPDEGERFILGGKAGINTVSNGEATPKLTSDFPLAILAGYYNGGREAKYANAVLYNVKLLNICTLEIEHDYVPWLDGTTPCIKDMITGRLFYNGGTGTFGYIDWNNVVHDS